MNQLLLSQSRVSGLGKGVRFRVFGTKQLLSSQSCVKGLGFREGG